MSDNAPTQKADPRGPMTMAEVIEGLQPMGDLDQFAIKDLTPEDEDKFFGILEDA